MNFKNIRFILSILVLGAIYAGCKKADIKMYSYPAPQPKGMAPYEGYAGFDTVTITGSDFGDYKNAVKVFFNGVAADTIFSCEDGIIKVLVPKAGISGRVSLQVWTHTVDSIGSFNVIQSPEVDNMSRSLLLAGDTVIISGNGFGTDLAQIKVNFNGPDATITTLSDSLITAIVPNGFKSGNLIVTVRNLPVQGPAYAALSPVQDPIYWLQFEGNLTDKMGGASATYTFKAPEGKDMSYVAGEVGQAVKFEGTYNQATTGNQFMSLPKDITKQKELTVSCWVYWMNDSTNWVQEPIFDAGAARGTRLCLMTRMNTSFGAGYQNMIGRLAFENVKDAGGNTIFGTPPTYFNAIGKGPLPKKEWHHVAMVLSQTDHIERIFMDGVEQANVALTTAADQTIFTHSKVYIGAPTNGTTKEPSFGGMIDEFKVFNYALTTDQVFTEYYHSRK